ncbi:hypothetical protein M9Y10_009261 [Tritrichomonas musculus]|uniref:Uncharacterized protein n=1 Tax=Tritrichomonas musculus TaxID=1915356 RepID=A0ABR2IN12_9EUKA
MDFQFFLQISILKVIKNISSEGIPRIKETLKRAINRKIRQKMAVEKYIELFIHSTFELDDENYIEIEQYAKSNNVNIEVFYITQDKEPLGKLVDINKFDNVRLCDIMTTAKYESIISRLPSYFCRKMKEFDRDEENIEDKNYEEEEEEIDIEEEEEEVIEVIVNKTRNQ